MQLLQMFAEEGYEINFGTTAGKSERSASLEHLSILTTAIKLNDPSFDEFLYNMNPQVVLFDRFITEEQFGWRVAEACPKAIRILDTEDLHFLRKAREKAISEGFTIKEAHVYTETAKRELASILRCDLSLIISDYEMKLLQEVFNIPEGLLYYLPILFTSEISENLLPSFSERQNFVTVGNFQHKPNTDGVLWLAREIWPQIRKKLPTAEIHVYGEYGSQQISELHNESSGFLIKGWAPDVGEVMKTARVCLAPLRFGAGLKGKFFDAMINGTPAVTTSIGAEGIRDHLLFGGLIEDDVSQIISAAIDLFSEEEKWLMAQHNGFQILRSRFHSKLFSEPFKEAIRTLSSNLDEHRMTHFIGQIFQHSTMQSTKYMSKWIELKNKK